MYYLHLNCKIINTKRTGIKKHVPVFPLSGIDRKRFGLLMKIMTARFELMTTNRERKCADTTDTVLVSWDGHFLC